jgi:hypothetical protein
MKLKITTNYSFSKLSKNIDSLIDDALKDYALSTEKGSKRKIDRGLRALRPVTAKIRAFRNQPTKPALKASGALYNSIKQSGSELEMLEYGMRHHEGFTTGDNSIIPNVEIKARPFITVLQKDKQKIVSKFKKSINKSLKK